jgi:transcriptional antiterminator NusG
MAMFADEVRPDAEAIAAAEADVLTPVLPASGDEPAADAAVAATDAVASAVASAVAEEEGEPSVPSMEETAPEAQGSEVEETIAEVATGIQAEEMVEETETEAQAAEVQAEEIVAHTEGEEMAEDTEAEAQVQVAEVQAEEVAEETEIEAQVQVAEVQAEEIVAPTEAEEVAEETEIEAQAQVAEVQAEEIVAQTEAESGVSEHQDDRAWYVIHCYSGYENKVKHNLEQRIETMQMQDRIFQVVVPTEDEMEVRDGKRRVVERRVFPGYILVQMILDNDSWYVVRNTPGATGFVGMGNEPTPLRSEEVQAIMKRMEAEAPKIKVTFKSGQKVRIIDGPFNEFIGVVAEIDMERAKVRVLVSFFGRETPVELDFLQVEKA